jgi:hypothetical protein
MPRRPLLRALSALVVVGALGACHLGGGTPPQPKPHLVVSPDELVLDLPESGSGADTGTITVRNLSVIPAGPLRSVFTLDLEPGQTPSFTGPDPVHTCGNEILTLGESCGFTLTLEGTVPSTPPTELSWRLLDEDDNTLFYVPIRIV